MPPIRRSGSRPAGPAGKRVVAGRAQRPGADPAGSAPARDATADDTPTHVESIPAESIPADSAPAADAPVDSTPTGSPTADTPTDDTPTDDSPTDDSTSDDTPTVDAVDPDTSAPRRRGWSIAAAAAAVVVGVAAAVVGGLSLADHPSSPLPTVRDGNSAFVDTQRTEEVRRAATSAVQRLVSIEHQSLDEYHDTLGEYLSDELIAELDTSWPTLRQTYQDTKLGVDADVTDVGVSYLQDDQAEVLLVQDVSTTRDGVAAGSTTGTYLVTMSRIDGVWKLSKIPDLPS